MWLCKAARDQRILTQCAAQNYFSLIISTLGCKLAIGLLQNEDAKVPVVYDFQQTPPTFWYKSLKIINTTNQSIKQSA